jgi:hypothetical protein
VIKLKELRPIFKKARKITKMLQGTMGLEGQALDRKTLKIMTRITVKELLKKERDQSDHVFDY